MGLGSGETCWAYQIIAASKGEFSPRCCGLGLNGTTGGVWDADGVGTVIPCMLAASRGSSGCPWRAQRGDKVLGTLQREQEKLPGLVVLHQKELLHEVLAAWLCGRLRFSSKPQLRGSSTGIRTASR